MSQSLDLPSLSDTLSEFDRYVSQPNPNPIPISHQFDTPNPNPIPPQIDTPNPSPIPLQIHTENHPDLVPPQIDTSNPIPVLPEIPATNPNPIRSQIHEPNPDSIPTPIHTPNPKQIPTQSPELIPYPIPAQILKPNPDSSGLQIHTPNPSPIPPQIPTVNRSLPQRSTSIQVDQQSDLQFFAAPAEVPRKRRRGRPRSAAASAVPFGHVSQSQIPTSVSPVLGNSVDGGVRLGVTDGNELGKGLNSGLGMVQRMGLENGGAELSDEIIVINRDATGEALTALTSGFPADVLIDEEIEFPVVSSVGGIEQVNYILIRNHIITKWREDVMRWVNKEMFLEVVPKHYHYLLDSAYNYLVSYGYVNFGVAPSIKEKIPAEPSKPSVVIIGAGLAGLAAARQLMSFGFMVTVLEGRRRAGGRVYTKRMEGSGKSGPSAAADLGGSVLTGTLGNPLGILARQLTYTLHKVRDMCPIYRVDGSPVDPKLDKKVEADFNKLLDKVSKLRQSMGEVSVDISLGAALETFREDSVTNEEMRLFNWHLANLEYANACLLSKLSLAFWDQDDPYDMGGDHCFLSGGNGRLVQALTEGVPIFYEKTVSTIRYGSSGVQVIAENQVFQGDMALCTVPLGVLKNGSIKFVPELPQRKLDGIRRLGFGLLNKVAMLFPYVFWGTDLDTFGHLCEDRTCHGEFFLFYSYATVAGGPLLIALVAGEAAHKFETLDPADAVKSVIRILEGIYEPNGITVPQPIQSVCTRWGGDPFCLGSYSNVAIGASGDDYDILAESVCDGRLFFAGEATTRRYPATMHGAFLTGLREAANMAHSANVRALNVKIEKSPSKDAHFCATLLADLFREPDMEFGSYAIIYVKGDTDPKSTAILRITFNDTRRNSQDNSNNGSQHSRKPLCQQLESHFNQQQEMHIYTLISREQAMQLREVRGGNDMRLYYLTEKLGIKLVGRKGLGPNVDAVIAAIKAERSSNRPGLLALKTGMSKLKAVSGKQKVIRIPW
ncbi:FLOWERING LOCUS D-like protein [Drosera capensis]